MAEARAEDALRDIRLRVERKYANEVAETKRLFPTLKRDVSSWLAGVSYAEWFVLDAALGSLVARQQELEAERDVARKTLPAEARSGRSWGRLMYERFLEAEARLRQTEQALRELCEAEQAWRRSFADPKPQNAREAARLRRAWDAARAALDAQPAVDRSGVVLASDQETK